MKFLKTIRFDPSDTHVYEAAAEPDEWAVPGGFSFADATEDSLKGKARQAFSNGFLSLESRGHSTFVSVAGIDDVEVERLQAGLAAVFVDGYGAPTIEAAMPASTGEIGFVLDMCADVPINSIFTVRRFFDEAGEIKEEFRIVDRPGEKLHARVWDVVEDEA